MTTTQWLFEYYALQKKGKEDIDLVIETLKAARKMLVNVLGLDLLNDVDGKNDEAFMPLVMMAGRRGVVESILDKIKKNEELSTAINDENFDAVSKAMAVGDMEPIISLPTPDELVEINKREREKELRSLGIKLVDTIPDGPHININQKQPSIDYQKKPIKMRFDDNG